jgi:acyl-CoA thioesterase
VISSTIIPLSSKREMARTRLPGLADFPHGHYRYTDTFAEVTIHMDNTVSFFESDNYSRELGIILVSASPGRATMELNITDKHRNSHGTVHGGVIFSLADEAFAIASNSHGVPSVAINISITYMKAATGGKLIAKAEEFSVNPKLGSYIVEVYDQEQEKVAIFQGLAYRKRPRG